MNAKEKLIESFFNLLSVKDFNSISISELCKVANVHRSTFYSYFDNLYELLEASKEFALKKFSNQFNIDIVNLNDDLMTFDILTLYLSFIKKNKNLYVAYFTNAEILSSNKSFSSLYENIILPRALKQGLEDENKLKYITLFFVGGITNIIKQWIDNNFNDSVEYLANIIIELKDNSINIKKEK